MSQALLAVNGRHLTGPSWLPVYVRSYLTPLCSLDFATVLERRQTRSSLAVADRQCKTHVLVLQFLPCVNTDRLQFGRAYTCLYFLCDGGAKLSTALALYRLFEPRKLGPRILAWCSVVFATLPIALSLLIFNINCSQPFAAVADNALCPMQVSRLNLRTAFMSMLRAHLFRFKDQSLDRHYRYGHRRGVHHCPMCFMSGLSRTNQPTQEDGGSDCICRQSRVHSFLNPNPAHDTQDGGWLGWMDDPNFSHHDY